MLKMKAMLCLLLVVVASCGEKKASADGEELQEAVDSLTEDFAGEQMPVSAEELFDDFIFNFTSNKRLQMERVSFPLEVETDSCIQHVSRVKTRTKAMERAKWKMETFFMSQDYYTLIFDGQQQMEQAKDTTVGHVVVEHFYTSDDYVCRYIFDRKEGRWMLTKIHNQAFPRNANASFLSFYQRFAADSLFQIESLSKKIHFVGPDPDDDFAMMEGIITPEFWDAFKPWLPETLDYNIVYGHQNPAATEKILVIRGIANGMEMELTFRLEKGRWLLVKLIT